MKDLAPGLDAEAGWPRRDRIALLVLVAGLAGSLPFLVHPWFDPMPDASMYLITARSLLAGDGYTMLGEPFHVRPPGLPAILVPFLAAFGNDFHVLNLVVASFGALAVLLGFLLYRPTVGGPLALLCGAVLWLNPAFRTFSNQLLSDVPGTALMLLALVLERHARRSRGAGLELLLGLAVAAATYVRTMGVLLVPAIWLSRWLVRRRAFPGEAGGAFVARRLAVFAGVALLALFPWQVRQARLEPVAPADQTFVYSYGTGMFHEDVGDPASPRLTLGEILDRSVHRRFSQLAGTAGHRLLSLELDAGAVAWSAFFLAALLVRLVRRREPTELLALMSMAVLSIYFGYQERLFLPVYVLLLFAGAELARDLARWLVLTLGRGHLPAATTEAVVAGGLVAVLSFDLDLRADWGLIRKRHRDFLDVAELVNSTFPPPAVLATGSGFEYQVYLERPVWSLSFTNRRGGPEAVEALLDAKGVDVVLLWRRFKQDRELQNWLPGRYVGRELGPLVAYRVR